ncbi:MAG TPA: Gfo/Idh/MocA family oxidoreductase [Planctomycetota bacterium]
MATPSVGVLGCGYWGKNHVRNYMELGALAAVCDPSQAGRETAAKIAPGARVVDNPQAIFDDPAISGVVIATPAETHVALCAQAFEAGKDVLCEKPLALRYEDAQKVNALAHKHNRLLMVGHILEYHAAVLKLAALIKAGELGKVQYIYSNRLNLGKIRREENILWSFAPHDIAVILRLLGDMPFQVMCGGGAYVQPNIADVTVTQMFFDNGVGAHIFVSWLNPFKEQRLVVIGNRRMAVFNDVAKELVLYDQSVKVEKGEPIPVKGEGQKIAYDGEEPLRRQSKAFLEAIATRQPPLTDGESALRVLRVLNAAQRSLMTQGQPVMLPIS